MLARIALALAALLDSASCSAGRPYVMASISSEGGVSGRAGGMEGGIVGRDDTLAYMLGFGATLVSDDGAELDGVEVEDEGEFYVGAGLGIAEGILLFATGGIWSRDLEDDSAPPGTPGSDQLASGGLHVRCLWKSWIFSLGVHSERGIVLGFGAFGDLESVSWPEK